MTKLKILRAAAIAAAALMAFAGTASATTVTSPVGSVYTGQNLRATAANLSMHSTFNAMSCKHSSFEGRIEAHGASVTASGKLASFTFGECAGPTTVKKAGSLILHSNGLVTSTGAEIATSTWFGECIYTTNNTTLGTLTSGSPAQIDLSPAVVPRTGGSFNCGASVEWTGSYTFTQPSGLWVD